VAVSDKAKNLAEKLHSRYQPQAEADRYIAALNIRQGVDYFILVEPGLGFLIQALKNIHPESKTVILHADNCFRDAHSPQVPAWYPDSEISVQEFLEKEIPEAATIQIIEWKPAIRVFGDFCLALVRESADFIRRAAASRRTGAAFGRKWVRNFVQGNGYARCHYRIGAKP
jgi:hypothetical protein